MIYLNQQPKQLFSTTFPRTNAVRGKGDKVWYQQVYKSMNKFAEVKKK